MNNPLPGLISLVQNLIDTADARMLEIIKDQNNDDVYFSAPDVILRLLESAMLLENEVDYNKIDFEKFKWLDHMNIIPSKDWAITLFHKDYPLYKHDWMIREVLLAPLMESEHDIYEQLNTALCTAEMN